MDTWRWAVLRKFPVLDLGWPADVQAAWWRSFWCLWLWGDAREGSE